MAWNGRQLINHPAELDIAHVRAGAMNAPACVLSTRGHVSNRHTRNSSAAPLLLASCSPYSRSIPLVSASAFRRSNPSVFVYQPLSILAHSICLSAQLQLHHPLPPPFHPRMHPPSSADCESPSRYTRAVPSIVSIEGGHDGINYNA